MDIKLRKYKISDLQRHLELLKMNGVHQDIEPEVVSEESAWIKKIIIDKNNFCLAIIFNKQLVGNIILKNLNSEKPNLGFWVGKEYQNKGIASKALNIFLSMVKKKIGPRIISAEHTKRNLASEKVLIKNNFKIKKRTRTGIIYEINLGELMIRNP